MTIFKQIEELAEPYVKDSGINFLIYAAQAMGVLFDSDAENYFLQYRAMASENDSVEDDFRRLDILKRYVDRINQRGVSEDILVADFDGIQNWEEFILRLDELAVEITSSDISVLSEKALPTGWLERSGGVIGFSYGVFGGVYYDKNGQLNIVQRSNILNWKCNLHVESFIVINGAGGVSELIHTGNPSLKRKICKALYLYNLVQPCILGILSDFIDANESKCEVDCGNDIITIPLSKDLKIEERLSDKSKQVREQVRGLIQGMRGCTHLHGSKSVKTKEGFTYKVFMI